MTSQAEVPPTGSALPAAAELLKYAAGIEETRFNNLNNRAIALVSGSSVVTALLGFFAKDILTTDALSEVRGLVAVLTTIAVLGLILAIGVLLRGVLIPGGRLSFGNNAVTEESSVLNEVAQVQVVQWSEYRLILDSLVSRNAGKAKALNIAYWAYGTALLSASVAVFVILWR